MMSQTELDEEIRTPICAVQAEALARLRTAPFFPIRKTTCSFAHGVLTLHGEVENYFQKQVAQELVRTIDGIQQVVNNIEVVVSHRYWSARKVHRYP
jgi:hypothetical protein